MAKRIWQIYHHCEWFEHLLTETNRPSGPKVSKDIEDLNRQVNKFDLMDICNPEPAENIQSLQVNMEYL